MFKVNKGNRKLGSILSINLPAIKTCVSDAPCKKTCYATRGAFKYPNVINCYDNNLKLIIEDIKQVKIDILNQVPYNGYLRLHSSGDFYNREYLEMFVEIARLLPNLHIMGYTKKYEMINQFIKDGNKLPSNFTIIFSLWDKFPCNNPYKLPTSQVILNNGNNDIIHSGFHCTGRCDKCFHCWNLKEGENVIFKQH